MKKSVLIAVAIIVLFGGLALLNKSHDMSAKKTAKPNISQVQTFDSIQNAVQNGAKLYDVRTANEYKTGHFAGAANWSLQDMQAGKLPEVPKDTKIYVYCHSGNRSGQATAILKDAGYTNITDLHGLTNVETLGGKLIAN